jgi:predicted O-methyltransferase YrrM
MVRAMDDLTPDQEDLPNRLERLERALEALAAKVSAQHGELMNELKLGVYDIHRNIHARGCQDAAAYVAEHMQGVPRFDDRAQLLDHLVTLAAGQAGDLLEFGVAGGVSLRQLAGALPERRVFGFDSFQGLPEDWYLTVKRGAYAARAEKIRPPPNVTLVPGWFEDSLPAFLGGYEGEIALIHIDCDLYSSTTTVLSALAPLIRPGCLLEFDEYMNYGGWRDHEFKAWQEFVAARGVRYDYLGYTRRGSQCAVRVTAIG